MNESERLRGQLHGFSAAAILRAAHDELAARADAVRAAEPDEIRMMTALERAVNLLAVAAEFGAELTAVPDGEQEFRSAMLHQNEIEMAPVFTPVVLNAAPIVIGFDPDLPPADAEPEM